MDHQIKSYKESGKAFIVISIILLVMGAVCLYLNYNVLESFRLILCAVVFAGIGVIFLVLGLCFLYLARRDGKKLQGLLTQGKCYDAEIVRIYDKSSMQLSSRGPLIVECVYIDEHGKSYLVKNGHVLLSNYMVRESDLKARVWVNPDNAKEYYAEVYTNLPGADLGTKYDFDYR